MANSITNKTYHEQQDIKNNLHLRELLEELPRFCKTFFRGIEPNTSSRTRIAYAVDLKVFFEFISANNPIISGKPLKDISIDILSELTAQDIEEYLEYLKVYTDANGRIITNNERGIKRKISSLRSFYNYLYRNQFVTANPASQVAVPKLHEKAIIRLDADETKDLLDYVENGQISSNSASLRHTKRKETYRDKNKTRNLAIVTLLLGTGIRVSECVGLDVNDVDFKEDRIKVVRKGGSEAFVYFGSEVKNALETYLLQRNKITPAAGHEQALFLSSRKTRMGVRNIEILVKEYASESVSLKKITPHKLRSTYGTSLYKETGDIYLVADVLGHKDVNTTRKHYAALDEERRRMAKDMVQLRKRSSK